ncbi:MAG: GntR family transcriptional regulator [Pseudonocardiaceae bacterium]
MTRAEPGAIVHGVLSPVSLAELAVRQLRSEILSGALAPGERLVEEHLTRRLGISRAPLREALRLLGQQGLVAHLPRRGARVAELSARDIDELFSLRDVLERFAMSTALPLRVGLSLDEPAAALAEMDRAATAGEAVEQAEAHRRFHLALVGLAEHQHLLRVYEPVVLKLQLYMAVNLRREAEQRSPMDGVTRHRKLLDVVADGRLDRVLTELGEHGARRFLS